ncbi:MAG: WYL domain-containing transcriptional regulator [Deltaproteobacteria bacterium]|nr:WYL domain-containing transcriptional regulator [Deltaproteobacteria bacterium]
MDSADCTGLNKGQKLVRLIEWMQRREGIRVSEIQDRFELDPRSLRRYIADLKELQLPILEEGKGTERVLFLDPSYRRSGLQLTLGEMISLRFGRILFNFLEGTQFATDLTQAIDRLQPTVSRGTAETVQLFDAAFLAVPEHAKDYREMADVIDEVLSCLLYSNPANARYRRARGQARTYLLEPLTLAVYRQGLYVFARDVEEDRIKTFALERFLSFERRRKEKFGRPASWDPVAFVADAFGIIGGPPRAVVVRFSSEVAEYIRERRWHRSQGFLDRPDGSVEVVLRCAITPELKQWILGFGPDAEVLEPEDLRRDVQEALEQAARRYRQPT